MSNTHPNTAAWQALETHYASIADVHMRDLFNDDDKRAARFSVQSSLLFLDYSKNRIVEETITRLITLARESAIEQSIDDLFSGKQLNSTEGRAALHTALRNRSDRAVFVEGENVMPGVRSVLDRMRRFSEALKSGEWRGYSDKPITDVVNIGIGGSHLGPMMVTAALRPYRTPDLNLHFVANVDGADISQMLETLRPETTLFIIASKTFTTQETMTNAKTARSWLLATAGDESAVARHFVAVSANLKETGKFGIDPSNVFELWDWVGGRYSVWSAIGLPVALSIGMKNFQAFLGGAHEMDEHFRRTDLIDNIPVILALLGIWYTNFFNAQSHAVVPYEALLSHLPAYLQQLDMESNGKSVDLDGKRIGYTTGPVIWGAPGTDGQHAFFQSLHQGTLLVPVDFVAGLKSHYPLGDHHKKLLANCFAQSEALMRGKTADEVREELSRSNLSLDIDQLVPHKTFPGNRPSNTILYEKLTPRTLGALLAMYEHKVFVQGRLLKINSFDQWGVELGKQLANQILSAFDDKQQTGHDCSTEVLISRYKQARYDD